MKLGVIDVGSNTVHLLVVEAKPGASPVPNHSQRSVVRLMRYINEANEITEEGIQDIITALHEAARAALELRVDDLIVTVTSAVREAANGDVVLERMAIETGLVPQVLSGEDEARITMLAVRRWFGWSAGELLLFDIGGGSFEIAQGADEYPDVSVSLPLGAGRTTINFLREDPPPAEAIAALRSHAKRVFERTREQRFSKRPKPQMVVGTSKTIRSLARLIGGPEDPKTKALASLHYAGLKEWEPVMMAMPSSMRQHLPGITPERAYQILAGSVVLRTAMKVFGVKTVTVSPWALREGIVLRYIDALDTRGAEPPLLSSL